VVQDADRLADIEGLAVSAKVQAFLSVDLLVRPLRRILPIEDVLQRTLDIGDRRASSSSPE